MIFKQVKIRTELQIISFLWKNLASFDQKKEKKKKRKKKRKKKKKKIEKKEKNTDNSGDAFQRWGVSNGMVYAFVFEKRLHQRKLWQRKKHKQLTQILKNPSQNGLRVPMKMRSNKKEAHVLKAIIFFSMC